jgi:CarD family transcriptional regulator
MKATARPKASTKTLTPAKASATTKPKTGGKSRTPDTSKTKPAAATKANAPPKAAAKAVKVPTKTAAKPAAHLKATPNPMQKAKAPTKAAPASKSATPPPAATEAPKPMMPRGPAPPAVTTPVAPLAPSRTPIPPPPSRAIVSPPPPHRPPQRPSASPAMVAAAAKAPPRQKEDFKAGDHVVYPTHGVGQVQGIETVEAAGYSLQVIVVTFEENRMTLRVPVNKAASSGLRKLAAGAAMQMALDTLKGRARIKRTMWSRRAQEYEAKINSGDPLQIAEVVRDLHRNAGQPDQSFSERQIYEQALDRLAAEVAAIDATDKQGAIDKILLYLSKADKGEKGGKGDAADKLDDSED